MIRTKTRWSSNGKMMIKQRPMSILKKIKAKYTNRNLRIPRTRCDITYTSPDGTPVSIKDMDLLLEVNKTRPSEWLRGYKRWKAIRDGWKMNKERSDTMAKKKKRAKKKVSPLDKIRKQMDKLEALHENESDIVFEINEIIDDAQMEDDICLDD